MVRDGQPPALAYPRPPYTCSMPARKRFYEGLDADLKAALLVALQYVEEARRRQQARGAIR